MYIPVLTAVVEETEKEDVTMLNFVATRLQWRLGYFCQFDMWITCLYNYRLYSDVPL